MIFFELYNIALTLSVITGAAIAAWLWFRARGQEGMQPLAYFSAGVSLWCGAILAIQHGTPTIVNLALWLLPLGVLNPAFFLHFASRFVYNEHKMFVQAALYPLYGLSAVLIVFGFWFKMATPMTWLTHFQVFTLTPHGWVVSGFATLISTLGYIVLFHGWLKGNVKKRRQVLAVLFSGGLGFFCTIAFLWPSLNINLTPYPLLILPFYNLLLVYGIQRYEIMKLNRWANRAMVWLASMLLVLLTVTLLLVFLAQLGFNEIADVPLGQMWVLSLTLILLFLFMQKPVVSLIDQLVYPGLKVNTGTLNSWRLALDKTNSVESMQAQAKAMLKATLRQDIDVIIHQGDNSPPIYRAPALVLQQDNQQWVCHSKGWKGATPSEQRLGDLFSNVLLSSVMQLDKNLELIKQQQDQIEQQHLAEMGLLSAAVAHDLRNPLNIISMAATQCNESTRQDIKTQLARADHLIKDLLNYTGELVITAQQVGMLAFIQPIIKATLSDSTHITCDISPEFSMNIDPFRLQQVLTNLLSNAENALQNHPDGKIHITAHTTTEHQLLHISDNGSGIPDAFQDSIFKPFATRRTGGIGLGLAISKRIIDAHQGSIRLIPQSINELRTLISRIAPAPISVLITGPSGTGKELVARALHQLSTRKPQQFVSVHGAAISSELIESELFGHVKGAFTGAHKDRAGLVTLANGGTLFFDEVGDMPATMQVKLLRFLQEGTYYPVGSSEELHADVRVVAATHRDLLAMVKDGQFREDLYYRLKGVELKTPSLSERPEDIPVLSKHFVNTQHSQIETTSIDWLLHQAWPGNVRELFNVLEFATSLCHSGEIIQLADIQLAKQDDQTLPAVAEQGHQTLDEQLRKLEKTLIISALEATEHNHTHTATRLGISRVGLLKKMTRLGLR